MGSIRSFIAGAALAATAIFLSDKKNREKILKKGKQIKADAEKEWKELKQGAAKTVTGLKDKAEKAAK